MTHPTQRLFLSSAFALGLLGVAIAASAQDRPAPAPAQLEGLIRSSGASTCVKYAGAFGPAMTGPEGAYAALVQTHPAAPAAAMLSATVERRDTPRGSLALIDIAPTERGCDMVFTHIQVLQKSCEAVAREDLARPAAESSEVPLNALSAIRLTPLHHVYLMQTAAGCITINKELLFPM